MITRFRYAWEPNTFYQTDGGAPAGGGNPPGTGQPPAGEGAGDGKTDGDKGGDGDGDPDPAKTLTQADVDRIVAKRLTEEKEREKKRTEDAVKKAEVETARKNGEWQKVAEGRESEIATLNQQITDLQGQLTERDTALIRSKVAAKHRIPQALVDRIRGTTEQEMDADAKEMAKLIAAPTAPETEAGRGNGKGSTQSTEQIKNELAKSGRFRI